MSKRLQVLLEEDELAEIRTIARQQRLTVAEWVRQALRAARRQQPRSRVEHKLAALHSASRHAFPTADIELMLAEIARAHEVD